jgi:glycosyltransferase involved in cell wall biosynthesis
VDLDLLNYIIKKMKNFSFVFIGPVREKLPFKEDNNVYLLGKKSYEELPDYINQMDVCLLPYKQDKHMQSANPIIMYEYLSLGKPVVSTFFPEVEKLKEIIFIANSKEDYAVILKRVMAEENEGLKIKRRETALLYSWDTLMGTVESVMDNKLAAKL